MVKKIRRPKNQTSFQSLFFPLFLLVLLLVIIGFLVSSNFKINQKRKEFKTQIEALKKEIQILEEKNQQLKAEISESQKEGYLEKEAREKLGLKKPGEEVVVVLPPEKSKEEKKEEKSLWQRFLDPVRNFFERF